MGNSGHSWTSASGRERRKADHARARHRGGILDETLPPHVTVHELAISPPVLWEEQRERMGVVGEET